MRKRPRTESRVADKHSSPPTLAGPTPDDSDVPISTANGWPASQEAVTAARAFLTECAHAQQPVLLLPDKDADGLCSGFILHRTLLALGLAPSLLSVHFVAKGSNVHAASERAAIARHGPRYIILADQGSRACPPIADDASVRTLIVDHHQSDAFPDGAQVLSAAHHEPVATSSTLAYILCRPLVLAVSGSAEIIEQLEYLCVMGTIGDLGTAFRWDPPFPDMRDCIKRYSKKVSNEAVSLLNAPRRTARYDVLSAWTALLNTSSPRELVSPSNLHARRLHAARKEVREETQRCAHTAPTFSGDGRVALIRISSGAQVHPLIATRWASTLKSTRLEMVMCANDGYLPGQGMTNFACRVARCAKHGGKPADDGDINIIEMLKDYADRVPGLRAKMGEDFARGHKQASGGIVRTQDFERLWSVMLDAEPVELGAGRSQRKKRKTGTDQEPAQTNTLEGWIRRKP
ncbi:DHH phosphoesterase [Laetiporus sulphureus 93-53]|uniref:DHH phosphoesterase n=1 Tax=Laetiporus sulphureus 93-53 TaxID=1314785 RepID=A0A165BEV8_9APHY|nr:DHH phosphoesterase [Laetiporus sulphureus 93-53]KZT00905.1 DHH phosphoesterase [Laetiporus sulphureus 93-53]